jgi:hypothetical protein
LFNFLLILEPLFPDGRHPSGFSPNTGSKSLLKHDLEGYAIAATKNQVFEAILIMMLRSLQAISRAFFMINLPSRVLKKEALELIYKEKLKGYWFRPKQILD